MSTHESHRQPYQIAYAELRDDKVTVHKGQKGTKIDEQRILHQLSSQATNSKIYLTAKQQQPLSPDSKTVQNEKKQLQKLIGKKVSYKVEKQTYHLTTGDDKHDAGPNPVEYLCGSVNSCIVMSGKAFGLVETNCHFMKLFSKTLF